jgi:hypothetical protein
MEDIDTQHLNRQDEDTAFLSDVWGDDHELLFLDSYLADVFRGRSRDGEQGDSGISEESTI